MITFTWLDRSYLVDWLVSLLWFGIAQLWEAVPVFERDINHSEPTISHKFRKKQRVSSFLLQVISVGGPIIIVLVWFFFHRSPLELHHSLLSILSAKALQHLIVQSLKNRIGRLRPDFLDRCQWDGTTCTGLHDRVKDGRRSFPSGHASCAWVGMTFVFLYLCNKIHPLRRGHVFPPKDLLSSVLGRLSISLAPLAVSSWVAITRLEDYRHHKEDVVVGSFIGFSCAWLTYHLYFTSPFLRFSRQVGSPAREVYADNHRDSMELLPIPEEEEPLHPAGNRASQDV